FPNETRGVLAKSPKFLFSMLVEKGVSPFAVEREESVGYAVEDHLDLLVSLAQQPLDAITLGNGAGRFDNRRGSISRCDRKVMHRGYIEEFAGAAGRQRVCT